jgi:hypothetical protein
MPLIQNFKSTSLWKAFVLNSISASIVVVLAISIKDGLDRFTNYNNDDKPKTNFSNIIITLLITYSITMLTYIFMYFIFGYGGGMLSV